MRRRFIVLIACCTFLVGCSRNLPQLPLEIDKDGGFRLREISLAEAIERQPQLNNCGARAGLKAKAEHLEDHAAVKYPQFKGPEPLYGFAKFGREFLKSDRDIKYFFALDASGPDGYDTLYFDANHDLDLTNDHPLKLSKKPWPAGLKPSLTSDNRLMFEELALPIDFGPDYGVRPVKYLPVFIKRADTMHFVPATFYAGGIKIGDGRFDAILGQAMVGVNARLEGHVFMLYLMEPGKKYVATWAGADELDAYRFVDGKYYTTGATPMGDKLFVKPYTGELGTLRIGAGTRNIKNIGAAGSLTSPASSVQVGEPYKGNPLELQAVDQWQVPVGDYAPYMMAVHYDDLHVEIGYSFHSDGSLYNLRERPRMFPIQIRKDKPFVLELAGKPEIYFASPKKDSVYKPGDEVGVYAVLMDPVLDIMIRGLNENSKSLDPTVTITDSSGKSVAEGTMPFG